MTRRTAPGIAFVVALAAAGACQVSYIEIGSNLGTGAGSAASSTSTATASASSGGMACTPFTAMPCYDGPPGTEGVGICKAGTQECINDGSAWGPCTGEVLPQAPDCASGMDLHCDGMVPSCMGAPLWAKGFGPDFLQNARVATDGSGNVFLAGYFEGNADFGGSSPLGSMGADAIFLAKFGPDGSYMWAKSFGDANIIGGATIAADVSGNVLLTGYFDGMVDLGCASPPLSSAGGQDVFVAKFDPSGGCVWATSSTGAGPQFPTGIAADEAGNVLLTGYFSGAAGFGSGATLTSGTGQEVFVAKLGADGSFLWSKGFGDGVHSDGGNGIAVDASGAVLVTGSFQGTVDFGGGPLTAMGAGGDVFVTKLGPDASHVWSKAFGDGKHDSAGRSVAVDASGTVVVTGSFAGALDFGSGGPLSSGGAGSAGFVAELDGATGAGIWSAGFAGMGPTDTCTGERVAADASGNVLLAGSFSGAADFAGNVLASAGGSDAFLAKLNKKTGAPVWSRRFGDAKDQYGRSVATDASGNVVLAGDFAGSIYLGVGKTLVSNSGGNVFLAKFGP